MRSCTVVIGVRSTEADKEVPDAATERTIIRPQSPSGSGFSER